MRHEVRAELGTVLTSAMLAEQSKLLGVRGPLLERAVLAMEAVVRGRPPVLPAWQRYEGVVWGHLDPATLPADARERILIPSGLYGVTTGEDLIADYRLKMSVRLGALGTLASYWRAPISGVLRRRSAGKVVVDLLPQEHRGAVDAALIGRSATVVPVTFVSSDGRNAAGHAAKAVKGIVARRVLTTGLGALERFEWEGWTSRHGESGVVIVSP